MKAILILCLFPLIFSQLALSHSFQIKEQGLDLSQVYILYSNVFIVGRTEHPMSITLVLQGPYKQTGWLVLASPWKPLLILANNTDQPFVELTYDPQQMTTNPISNTSQLFAWDYDGINEVIFMKLLITFTVAINIQFGIPIITEFISDKENYLTSETVKVTLYVYGDYTAVPSTNWSAKVIIKDMINNTVRTFDQEFQLPSDRTQQLPLSLGTFDEGTYTAIAEIVDPRTGFAVASRQLTFDVRESYIPPLFSPWTFWMLLALIIITLIVITYINRRKRAFK